MVNGQVVCQCACAGYWSGTDCDQCLLNPLYGDAKCSNIQEPTLGDCTCHCPKYYVDTESCDQCIITPADCVHPKYTGYVNTDPAYCDCGECLGNYVGRDCSICNITSCPIGYAFNETDCTCYAVCGNDILSPGEQCEVGLMQEKDQICCTDCLFNSVGCDDGNSCTFDDLCYQGSCNGVDSLDFQIDQNRMPLSPGPIPTGAWSRWGITIAGIDTTPVLYDSTQTTTPRTNLIFPNSNPFGGDSTFGLVVAQETAVAQSLICILASQPIAFSVVTVLGVSKSNTHVLFYCADTNNTIYRTPVKTLTTPGGPGSAQFIPVPCGSAGLNAVCYDNLQDAAIGPLYTCETANLPLGAIGDYVWNDYNRDNVQDSIEVGIPSARVTLYDSSLNALESTTTDADGKYLFSNLYAGDYIVEFNVFDGYRFSTPVTLVNPNYLFDGRTSTFSLGEGQIDLTRDAGLYFTGRIGDTVWYDENQDGIQTGASPEDGVPGVTVNLYYSNDKTTIISTTVTDQAGHYLFDNLYILKAEGVYYSYAVEVVPPPNSIITTPFQGPSTLSDSNFDVNTHFSNDIVLHENILERFDLSIDCGIYYCCGSIGDYVWYDVDADGIQDGSETGVASSTVVLYWNRSPYATTTTDSNGYYLFSGLPLYGVYNVHFTLPSTSYIFTKQNVGDDASDSDASASGNTGDIILTKDVRDIRTVDAGIISGCSKDSDCAAPTDQCATATCESQQCKYVTTVICPRSTDPCFTNVCNSVTGNCDLVPTGNSCDDGNFCTDNDRCTANGCKGTPNTKSCNDGLFCTENDKCTSGVCKGQPKTCSASTNACTTIVCDESSAGCTEKNVVDATPCEDGLKCTVGDVCVGGQCQSGTPVTCSLGDPCHTIQCSELTGSCQVTINNGKSCDDQNSCTTNDVCSSSGVCSGSPVVCSQAGLDQCHVSTCSNGVCRTKFIQRACDDHNLCTDNDACIPGAETCQGIQKLCPTVPCLKYSCNSLTGSCVAQNDNTQSCTDNNPCTVDQCLNGKCVSTAIPCDDGNACTTDSCVAGVCVHINNFDPCNDNNACTQYDACSNGACKGIPLNCDDNEICTSDYCQNGVCKHDAVSSTISCDDANACTPSSYCVSGHCQGFDSVQCDDGNPCTDDVCDPVLGECLHNYNTISCDDGNACTQDGVCTEGVCVSSPVSCLPVENICLEGVCIAGQCHYQPNPNVTTCDDKNACTENDLCTSGACVGTPKVCTPIDVCHDVSCVNGECVQVPNTASCDDGNTCTTHDICKAGVCAGVPVVCDDKNPCTDDVCNVAGICEYHNNTAPCDDENACTSGDACYQGSCKAGSTTTDCDDYNACTSEQCDPITGLCIFTNVDGPCNDLNGCTENDQCVRGVCKGTPVVCTGDNICLNYFCNQDSGKCDSVSNTNPCDDNNNCTSYSSCLNGACVGSPIVCTPADTDCTKRSCNPSTGLCDATYLNSGICSDGDSCTTNDQCVAGVCKGTAQPCNAQCTIDSQCTPSDLCHTAQCVNTVCVNVPKACAATGNSCTSNTCSLLTGECVVSNVAGPCDDGNACTQSDQCRNGECVGFNPKTCSTSLKCRQSVCNTVTGSCDITVIVDNTTTCDDNIACTVNDVCTVNGCAGTQLVCNDNNPCTTDYCSSGVCKFEPNINSCSDGNSCTQNDYCTNSQCVSGTPINCDDSNVCTLDSCISGECSHVKVTGTSCTDNNLCSVGDVCFNGECSGTPKLCDDNNPCTLDSCNPTTGECVFVSANEGDPCTDSNPCTSNDVCTSGVCKGEANCPVANTVIDQCVEYHCDQSTGGCIQTYSSGKACTSSANCYKTNGICSNTGVCVADPISCEDNNACTLDSCDITTGLCVHENKNISCTPLIADDCHAYACVNTACVAVTPKDCDDHNECTRDSCNNGVCSHFAINGASCSDGNDCTESDTCNTNGVCVGVPKVCDDGNLCTTGRCANGVCIFDFNSNPCTSPDKCAQTSVCSAGQCVTTSSKYCDAVICNDAYCDSLTGECKYIPNDQKTCANDDSNLCTLDVCSNGVCTHPPVVCAPSPIACQEAYCDINTGVCGLRNNDSLPCDDFNLCTTDVCHNGACQSTSLTCTDSDLCTYDGLCNPSTGACSSTPYSCHLSPCLYHSCVGDGRCQLTGVAPNYVPIIYLSVRSSSGTYAIYALNATKTNAYLYYTSLGSSRISSLDIDPNSGDLFGVLQATQSKLVKIARATDPNGYRNVLNSFTNLQYNVPSNMDISSRALYVSNAQPYKYYLYGLEPNSDKFIVYNETGSILSNLVLSAPTDAALLSWDPYGRTAFYFKKNDKHMYLWQDSYSVQICPNIDFGSGSIVSIDTAVDGTIFVGVGSPIAVYAVTFQFGTTCPYSKLSLPSALGNALLLSLTVDNTYCPLFGASPSSTPSPTPSASPSNTTGAIIIPPPPATGSVANPGGNLGSAQGGSGVPSGQDTNVPLTGKTGYISTAVVGSIAGVAVFAAAIFGAIIGLNTTKDEKAVPLATALDTPEVQSIAMNNPAFQPNVGVFNSAL